MEGLFAVIFIIIGIANFVMKQQQEQNRRQGGTSKQQPVYKAQPGNKRQPLRKPDMDRKPVMEMKDFRNEGMKSIFDSEGVESENRNRTGSMDYIEQSQSLEGECYEHPEHRLKNGREQDKRTALGIEVMEIGRESAVVELTEDNLLSSIVMAEILGPPRALKRSIR